MDRLRYLCFTNLLDNDTDIEIIQKLQNTIT